MEGSSTPISTASSIVVDDKSDLRPNVLECHICMEPPSDPVATSCGHVFCWPCMYQWLRNGSKPCPICRSQLHRDRDILPLYGAGSGTGPSNSSSGAAEAAASDSVIPPRPRSPLSFKTGATACMGPADSFCEESREVRRQIHELIEVSDSLMAAVADLQRSVTELQQRNSDLNREAVERGWRHSVERSRMAAEITSLQRQLAEANRSLGMSV